MPLAVATKDTVTNVKIISGTFSGAWILSELSLTVILTNATENHHLIFHFFTSSTTQSFIVLINISSVVMFSIGEQIRSRPYIHQSPKVLEITNVSLSQIEWIKSWFMFQYSIRSKKYTTVTLQPRTLWRLLSLHQHNNSLLAIWSRISTREWSSVTNSHFFPLACAKTKSPNQVQLAGH
jgi:hypothetical protein